MPKSKKTKRRKRDDGVQLTEQYIEEQNPIEAFHFYIKMLQHPKKFKAPPEALHVFVQENINRIEENVFVDIIKGSSTEPDKVYLQLYYLSQLNETLNLPDKIKMFLVENVDQIRGSYFDNSKHFNPKDPLIESLTWYSQLNLPKGTLNKPHSALAAFYADARDPQLLSQVNNHVRGCSFVELQYFEWVAHDFNKTATRFAKKISKKSENEIQKFNEDLQEFLTLSSSEQPFVTEKLSESDKESMLKNIKDARVNIAKIYFQTKVTLYDEKDWQLFNDIQIIKALDNRKEILEKAIFDIKNLNPDYFKDKNNWLGILLSEDKEAIKQLNDYVLTLDAIDMSYLARMHNKIIDNKITDINKKEHRAERVKFLRHAALRGDSYAISKLQSFSKQTAQKNEITFAINDRVRELEAHLSFLYMARSATGLNKLKYVGSTDEINDKIRLVKETKKALYQLGDDWLAEGADPNKIDEVKQKADNISLESKNDFKRRQKRFDKTNTLYSVLSLGIPRLHGKIKKVIANQLADSSTMQSSGYKYWDKNYFAVIDAMDNNPKACNRLEKIEKKEIKSAKQQIKQAKNKIKEAEAAVAKERKSLLGRIGIKRTAQKELAKAKNELAFAEKLKYRAKRNKENIVENSFLSDNFPGLEIEQRTIRTDDGAHLDVLVINNKHAQAKNPGKVKDIIHFSGRGCFYKLDDRHFQHAMAKGCNLIVVQDRLTSSRSYAVTSSQETLAHDGAIAVKAAIKMRKKEAESKGKQYDNEQLPIINGYCGGGPISVLTYEQLQKEGYHLKFLADRTFHSLSGMLEGWFSDDSRLERFKRWGTQRLAKPLLALYGWDVDVAGKIANIPEDKRIYVDVNAPDDEQNLYYKDETIDKSASIHTGLEKQRAMKLEQLNTYQQRIEQLREAIARPTFAGSEKDRAMILRCIEELNKTIEYVKSSYDITQIKAKEDDAHVDATKNFLLRDNTPLDDRLYEFINNQSEVGRDFFAAGKFNDGDPLKAAFYDFWVESSKMFADFYDNGKLNVELKHEDYDIRYRINALIYAINLYQFRNTPQYQAAQNNGFTLTPKATKEFISPELPKVKSDVQPKRQSYVPSYKGEKNSSSILVKKAPQTTPVLEEKKEARKSGPSTQ
ncbi:hypothetical protein [Candidatus Berkiella aquae]|uniref:Uncharacterized protein n=1 Tax=Candidatus Berkiella aquae TaxID=295108 RepID=A0A0Q9YKU7_9GAMM|nr:hypothetical protein [Candidatus Berkiella aquae]MCS5710886.1 hypothetical protein [Candidatus Berkiella aquae]